MQATLAGNEDAFVAKLVPDGSRLAFSTYLGGSGVDYGMGIAMDPAGAAYVFGSTASSDLPTRAAFQPRFGGIIDGFVAKLDASGSSLGYLTYLGGQEYEVPGDTGGCIAVDNEGNAYVAGINNSTDFPTKTPIQAALNGPSDMFISKLSPSGQSLLYSRLSPLHGLHCAG